MIAYGSNESMRVKCTAECNEGYCPECYVPCETCDSDGLCNVCSGLGYLTMKAYGSNEDILVVCTGGFCANGICSACQTVDLELEVELEQPETVVTEYSTKGFQAMKIAIEVDAAGKIVSVAVTEHNETPGFGAELIKTGFDTLVGQDITTAQIDIKSGVTMTSKGINDALKQAAATFGSVSAKVVEEEDVIDQTDAVVYDVKGFQPMKVAVEIDEFGKIASVAVIEHNETPGFGADLINAGFDTLVGQNIATAKIDAKSGVTMTSNAINDALKAAAASAPATETDSFSAVYDAIGFQAMRVAIDVDDTGKILSVEVIEHNETPGFGADLINGGFEALVGQNIAMAQIDIKAGVTMTSKGINDALKQAASASGFLTNDVSEHDREKEETDEDAFSKMTKYTAGQYKVGKDIPAGEYVLLSTGSTAGYFSVSSDANGDDILFNDNFQVNSIIEVRDGEYVELKRCVAISAKEFYSEYSIDEDNYGVMLKVGYDIWPGEYKLVTQAGKSGYYCIYNDARHDDIISNDNFDNSSYVTVKFGQYLVLSRCKIKK